MPEPTTTAAAAAGVAAKAVVKAYTLPVIMAAAGATIVFLMTMPVTKKQQTVALLSTFLGSIFGGAFALEYFNLEAMSAISKGAVYLVAGLPVWVIIRGFFAYTERDKSKGLLDYVKEVRSVWKAKD